MTKSPAAEAIVFCLRLMQRLLYWAPVARISSRAFVSLRCVWALFRNILRSAYFVNRPLFGVYPSLLLT